MQMKMLRDSIEIDLGYRGSVDLTIKFTDQNGITHFQQFDIQVIGEKPTTLKVDKISESGDRQAIFVSMK